MLRINTMYEQRICDITCKGPIFIGSNTLTWEKYTIQTVDTNEGLDA